MEEATSRRIVQHTGPLALLTVGWSFPLILDLDGRPMFGQDSTATRRREYGMYDVDQRFPKGYLDRLTVT